MRRMLFALLSAAASTAQRSRAEHAGLGPSGAAGDPAGGAYEVVASAPIEGFLHRTNELDTLGDDEPESPCQRSATVTHFAVMAGLVPAIHVFGAAVFKTWMPAT